MKIKTFSVNHYNRMGWGTKFLERTIIFEKTGPGGPKFSTKKIGPQYQNYRDQNSSDMYDIAGTALHQNFKQLCLNFVKKGNTSPESYVHLHVAYVI